MDGDRIGGEAAGICVGTCPNILQTFKQSSETAQDRKLTILYGPKSRFIEIIGDKGK
jgi:hypothetical protein